MNALRHLPAGIYQGVSARRNYFKTGVFFMSFGISAVTKDLNFRQNTMCQKCGKYSSVSVYMMYSTFSFFAPLFKWGKKYYAVSSCCDMVFSVSPEAGQAIERGEETQLWKHDMQVVGRASHCQKCGFPLIPGQQICPKCHTRL